MSKNNVKFHVDCQDYFGTLATILSLVRQVSELSETSKIILEKAQYNLVFLQKNYNITPKIKEK